MDIQTEVMHGDACGRALQMLGLAFSHPEMAEPLIELAEMTPYFDLSHADGSLYMGRSWLVPYDQERGDVAMRVHHLASPDLDRHLHDHPWDFVSVVLKGGYVEVRPNERTAMLFADDGTENVTENVRQVGSVAYRAAGERHRIVSVEPNTYTLFITGPKIQEWGFYTPAGKVPWREYLGVPVGAEAA